MSSDQSKLSRPFRPDILHVIAAIAAYSPLVANKSLGSGAAEVESAASPCDEPAAAFIGTGCILWNDGQGSIGFQIAGQSGAQQFTFSSGTSMPNIVAAVNAFSRATGVRAEADDPGACERAGALLKSIATGSAAFVSVAQLNGAHPLVSAGPHESQPLYSLTSRGRDAVVGDATCDRQVNNNDIDVVLNGWGPCSSGGSACPADITRNGVVDIDDLVRVISNWGANDQ